MDTGAHRRDEPWDEVALEEQFFSGRDLTDQLPGCSSLEEAIREELAAMRRRRLALVLLPVLLGLGGVVWAALPQQGGAPAAPPAVEVASSFPAAEPLPPAADRPDQPPSPAASGPAAGASQATDPGPAALRSLPLPAAPAGPSVAVEMALPGSPAGTEAPLPSARMLARFGGPVPAPPSLASKGAAGGSELVTRLRRLARAGRYQEALQQLAPARAAHPADPRLLALNGELLLETGQPRPALALLRQAVQLAPGDADACLLLGSALQLLGEHEEAQRAYQRYLRLDPRGLFAAELSGIVQRLPPR